MRIGTLRTDGGGVAALVLGESVVPLAHACRLAGERLNQVTDTVSLISQWEAVREVVEHVASVTEARLAGGELQGAHLSALDAPVPRPGKVIGIGRNYADHAAETGSGLPPEPMIFAKWPTAVSGPFDPIPRPAFVTDLDYEAELAVVIGRGGRDIAESEALEHVFGYCCANDVSARTAQMATGQFVRGKSFDGLCPMGPAIVTADEVGDPQRLRVRCIVDGEVRQDASTAQMIFPVARLVSHCSAGTTLEPGDVILTGTPAGVALGRTPSPWLEPGQLCEVDIERIGRIANRVEQG